MKMGGDNFEEFSKIRILTGTILEAKINPLAKNPAYILRINFGFYGMKTSSAQITRNYSPEDLVGMQITALVDIPAKRIAGVKSEVLVLGVYSLDKEIVLLSPTESVEDGSLVC